MVWYTSIGIHLAGSGALGDFLDVVERLALAGRPVPCVIVVNDGGMCAEIKRRSPKTYVVFRGNVVGIEPHPFAGLKADGTGTVADPAAWYHYMERWNSQAPAADAYSLYNERTFGGNTQSVEYARRVAEFDLGTMIEAEKFGKKIAFGNYFVGTPELQHVAVMGDMLRHAEAHNHPLIYHAYTSNRKNPATNRYDFTFEADYFGMRWARLFKDFSKLTIILGEVGLFNSPRFGGPADMVQLMTELDDLIEPYILQGWDVRGCWWTAEANQGEWSLDDITPALGSYEQYMMSREALVTMDRRAPVGEVGVDNVLCPPDWFDANPKGSWYEGPSGWAWHTGGDLNKNKPVWDSDAHAKIYAISDGKVIANADYGIWGRIVVIQHGPVYARYAHVEAVKVGVGQTVTRGQWIASVGNANGQQNYHLHFDISHTDILRRQPNHWPKADRKALDDNYLDPATYLRTGIVPAPSPIVSLLVNQSVNVRSGPSTSNTVITVYRPGRVIRAIDYNEGWYSLVDANGFVNKCCVEDHVEETVKTVWINAKPLLNIRKSPSVSSLDIGDIPYGQSTAVEPVTANVDWWKLVDREGYISRQYTQSDPIVTTPTWKPPMTAAQRGVHGNAGGYAPTPQELSRVTTNAVKWVLIPGYQRGQNSGIDTLKASGVESVVLRACGRGNPQAFFDTSIAPLREFYQKLPGDFMLAIHNEPNLYQEGAGSFWTNGSTFSDWWLRVRDLFVKEFPKAKFGFPALSPGGAIANIRLDETAFITGAKTAINEADWIGVHYYWTREDGTDIAPPVDNWKKWFGSKWLVGTEVGPADGVVGTGIAYGRAYSRFASLNIPIAAWLLGGAGSWQNADWALRNIVVV